MIYIYMASNIPIKNNKFLNKSIWSIDKTLTGTITLSQNGCGSNGNRKATPDLEPHHQVLFNVLF